MNPQAPNELPYQEQVAFSTEPMQAFRDENEICHESDLVNIFADKQGKMIACAFGLKNMGFYVGLVMAFGAPIGFGKVLYVVNGTAFVYYSLYPVNEDDSENSNYTGVISYNGNS